MPIETRMRLRAAWAVGLMFIATQLLNMLVMFASYGRWTYDHSIAVVAISIVAGLVFCLRYFRNPNFYAVTYSALLYLGVVASALPDRTGVNSALVPFVGLCPVICALMAGRGAAVIGFLGGGALLSLLLWISLSSPPTTVAGDYVREVNRYAQSFFALSLSTMIAVFVCDRAYALLSELRLAAERASRAEAARAEFLATMSHELRTPLNGVIGLAEALRRRDLAAPEKHLADTIAQSGGSLLRILNDVLDLSKIDAGKLSIELRAASPQRLVRDVVEAWRESAAAKGLSISVKIEDASIPELLLDDLRVSQILQNLASNAVKFTTRGSILFSLSATRIGAEEFALAFRVSDTGRGIEACHVARIFERYDQGAEGVARKFGGTGLGLPISRRLAGLMGGEISVERTGPSGTTFLFTMPARVAATPATQGAIEPAAPADTRLRVLVAEDNEVSRLVMSELLNSLGVVADYAEDGAACVAKAASLAYDLILLDWELPLISGDEAARTVRREGLSSGAVIIAVTGAASEQDFAEMLAAGVDDRIVKPVTRSALADGVRRAGRQVAA
jgi:signal transduction histidine kinase/CheY-like chemotaxis protein